VASFGALARPESRAPWSSHVGRGDQTHADRVCTRVPVPLRGASACRRSRRWRAAAPVACSDAAALPEVVDDAGATVSIRAIRQAICDCRSRGPGRTGGVGRTRLWRGLACTRGTRQARATDAVLRRTASERRRAGRPSDRVGSGAPSERDRRRTPRTTVRASPGHGRGSASTAKRR